MLWATPGPEHMPERMLDRMPERMSEYMNIYIYIPSPTIHAKKARCDLKHRVCKTKPGFVKTTMYPIQSTKSASSDGFGQNTGVLKKTPGFVDDHGATSGLYSNTSFFTGLVA